MTRMTRLFKRGTNTGPVDPGNPVGTFAGIPNQASAPVAGSTANGTAFTRYGVTVNGDTTRLFVPDSKLRTGDITVVFAGHGAGASHTFADATTGPQGTMRQRLLDAGYAVLAPNMHGSLFGNGQVQADLAANYAWVNTIAGWTLRHVLLWGESMGGGALTAALGRDAIPSDAVVGAALMAPFLNYTYQAPGADPALAAAFMSAYGATDITTANTNSAAYDPMRIAAANYTGTRFWIASSPDDTTVPRTQNSLAFQTRIGGVATTLVDYPTTGGHVSAQHYAFTNVITFFADAITAAEAGGPVVVAPPAGVPTVTATAGTGSVKFSWNATANAVNYQYRIDTTTPTDADTATATTALFVNLTGITGTRYAQVRAANADGVWSAWSATASATAVALDTGGGEPADFSGPAYDFATLTGPRYTPLTTLAAPVFSYPATSTVTTTGAIGAHTLKGDLNRVKVNPCTALDTAIKSKTTDNSAHFNVENWPVKVTDSEILTTVIGQSASGKNAASYDHCRIDPRGSIGPSQGAIYRGTCDIDYSEVIGYYDGLWNGDYTRDVINARYADGDFTSPYATRVRYSWIHMIGDGGFGNSTYSSAHYNESSNPRDYPMSETGSAWAFPMTSAQISGSIQASTTTGVAVHVGDFISPATGYENGPAGIYGGRWQVIGTTTSDRSPNAACTLGTDQATMETGTYLKSGVVTNRTKGWPHASRTWSAWKKGEDASQAPDFPQPFVTGTAILVYIGASNHSDACQYSRANGHVAFYRTRLESFTNGASIIMQPTNPPSPGGTVFDPLLSPHAHIRFEECDIILDSRGRVGFPQGAAVTDPITGTTTLPPAYGYKAMPRWISYINCWMGYENGNPLIQDRKLYVDGYQRASVFVATEAERFTGVLKQLDAYGVTTLTAANGGTLPTGAQMVASATLRSVLWQLEYQNHIQLPTDGYNGLPDNITNLAVFQNRLTAGLNKPRLDARTWIVWQNNRDRITNTVIDATIPAANRPKNPWLALDGSDGGFYTGP